ncbi:MAG TPA: hypothetical protein VK564_12895 [Thermodesulfobacteriota bacterium]|nr:hypothetical protein [Thermodesulfobacteriota bacterium]
MSVNLDSQGNLLSITIEHARSNARLQEFSYQEVASQSESQRTTV